MNSNRYAQTGARIRENMVAKTMGGVLPNASIASPQMLTQGMMGGVTQFISDDDGLTARCNLAVAGDSSVCGE